MTPNGTNGIVGQITKHAPELPSAPDSQQPGAAGRLRGRPQRESRVETLQWAVCLILGVPSALLILLNWLSFIGYSVAVRRGHKGGHSFAPPFLCGVAGAVACLVCPLPGVWRWAWVAPLLDPSIALLLVAWAMHVVARLGGFPSPFDGRGVESSAVQAEAGTVPDRRDM